MVSIGNRLRTLFTGYNAAEELEKAVGELERKNQVNQSPNYQTFLGNFNTQMRTIRSDNVNMFAQTDALVQEALNRRLYPLDQNGVEYPEGFTPRMWQVLNHPNAQMSFKRFMQSAMTSFISNAYTNILFWHRNDNGLDVPGFDNMLNVSGLTFLTDDCRFSDAVTGRPMYHIRDSSGRLICDVSEASVMSLSYMLDVSTMTSVSPGSASNQMSAILDLLAMAVRSFFQNSSTPALNVTIRSKTDEEFRGIKNGFERAFRGASQTGGTVYQQIYDNDPMGRSAPQVEITPIGTKPIDIDIQNITQFAQTAINANLGVSPLIYGDVSAGTDQVQDTVTDKFNRRVINRLDQFLEQLVFELNRVTGGCDFTIGYDFEDVEFVDKQYTKAQTVTQQVQAIVALVNSGADSDLAAVAIGRDDWKGLGLQKVEATTATQLTMQSFPAENMRVEGKGDTSLADKPALEQALKEPTDNRLAENSALEQNAARTRVSDRQPEAHEAISKLLTDMAVAHLNRRVKAQGVQNAVPDADHKYVNLLVAQLQQIADNGGVTVARQLAQKLTARIGTMYEMTGDALQSLEDRAQKVVANFAKFLDDSLDAIHAGTPDADTGVAHAPSDAMMSQQFMGMVNDSTIKQRINAITIAEGKFAFQTGQNDNAGNIQDELTASGSRILIKKVWHTTSGNPCPFCAQMDGQEAGVKDAFVSNGQITDSDGNMMVLDGEYDNGELPDAHVNCVAADTIVHADDARYVQTFNYSGRVVKLRTISGRHLTVTPNHILLTQRGWVRAKNLTKLDKIVGYGSGVEAAIMASSPADDNVHASIQKIVSSLLPSSKSATVTVPSTAEDFKGDGIPDKEVKIIYSNSLLLDKWDIMHGERFSELPFVGAADFVKPFNSFSSLHEGLLALLASTDGSISVSGERGTFGFGEMAHSEFVRSRLVSNYHTRLQESSSDNASIDVQGLRDFLLSHSTFVQFDDVLSVEFDTVHEQPFYDMQTTSTLYVANGLVSSNCQCVFTWEVEGND